MRSLAADVLLVAIILAQLLDLAWTFRFMMGADHVRRSPLHGLLFGIRQMYLHKRLRFDADEDATLTYFAVFLFIVVSVLIVFPVEHLPRSLLFLDLVVQQIAAVMLLLDLLLWTRRSTGLAFSLLRVRLEVLGMAYRWKAGEEASRTQHRLEELERTIEAISPSSLIPSFLLRVFVTILLLIAMYTAIYITTIAVEPSSFRDGSGLLLQSWERMAYFSTMITTGIGSDITANTPLARLLVNVHGLGTLYILALIISLFTTSIMDKTEAEKRRLLQAARDLKGHLGQSD